MVDLESIIKITIIVLTLMFIIVLVTKRFLYFRPSYEFMYPKAKFEEIMEGNIHAWFLQNDTSNKVLLFCHGNAGNLSHRQDKIIALHSIGFSVLIFDYRGFGQSKGVPHEENCYQNACMYAEMMTKKYGKENIVLYGESLGAPVASHVALKYNFPILILESGLPGISTFLKHKSKFLGLFGFIFNEFNTVDYLRNYKGRVLVLHCKNDDIIPWDSTEDMRKRAEKIIEMEGNHNSPIIPYPEIQKFVF